MKKLFCLCLVAIAAFACEKETSPLPNEEVPVGTSDSIKIEFAKHNGFLLAGEEAIGVSSEIPYFGSNLGTYPSQESNSTGITGLKAILAAGRFSDTNGTLHIDITGYAPEAGEASFEFLVAGRSFTLKRRINVSAASCGARKVHNYKILNYDIVSDADGNKYFTVLLNNKRWMAENLRTTRFSNGEVIPEIEVKEEWDTVNTPARCWYNNDQDNFECPYGKLYNYYCISDTSKNVCPLGWRIPDAEDWNEVITLFGGENQAAEAMKSAADNFWANSSSPGLNTSGFSGLAGGQRTETAGFSGHTFEGNWWVAADSTVNNLQSITFRHSERKVSKRNPAKNSGLSIRCVKNL